MAYFWANGNWEFNFGIHFNDWEMDYVQQCEVEQKSLNPQDSDKMFWKKYADGLFSVKSSYSFLEGESLTLAPVKIL